MPASDRKKQLKSALLHFYENPAAKVSLELFLSLGLILFLGAFAIRPTLVTMSDLLKEIEDKRELNQQFEQKIAALSTAQNEYRRLESQLSVLNQAIPESPELTYNLKLIERLVVDNQVVLQNISINEIPPEENINRAIKDKSLTNLPMNLTVVGDYIAIRSFVESLQENRRAIVVDSVTFSLNENNNQRELTARVAINFPYFGLTDESTTSRR